MLDGFDEDLSRNSMTNDWRTPDRDNEHSDLMPSRKELRVNVNVGAQYNGAIRGDSSLPQVRASRGIL
jgi:hypothetical protein